MLSTRLTSGTPEARSSRAKTLATSDLLTLLRCSHIFASSVHEVLQLAPLRQASQHALTPSQSNLLRVACRSGEHQVGQVAPLLGISTPAATKTIDRLERLGLVVRNGPADDRRTRLFSVSPAGQKLVRRCERLVRGRLRLALESFPPEEVAAFADMLARFSLSLLALEPAGSRPCLRCAGQIAAACPVARTQNGCAYLKFGRGSRRQKATTSRSPRRAGGWFGE